jgi:3D (Asp-Asp-Asp) domain-containing protein
LVSGLSLPLLAKNSVAATLPSSSGKGTKGTPSCASSDSATDEPKAKKTVVTVTSDRSRAMISAAALAAKPQPTAQTPAKTARIEDKKTPAPIARTSSPAATTARFITDKTDLIASHRYSNGRLARVTAYWAGEGDYYTGRCMSATGIRLHDGHCAVDPNIIPYGSVVQIDGVGKFLAVDTGSAVISRTAAREGGHTSAERNAIVVDVFFEDSRDGERFAAGAAKFVSISWTTPSSLGSETQAAGSLIAEADWSKIQKKQL